MTSELHSPLRIAMVAPPWYPVPPEGYGGIELVVHLIAQELAGRGHHVTLYAREDSTCRCDLVGLAPASWQQDIGTRHQPARECLHLRRAYELVRNGDFDVIHDHTGFMGQLVAAAMRLSQPVVSTLHGDLTEPDGEFLAEIDDVVHLVAISESQRTQLSGVHWAGVVHNPVDVAELATSVEKDRYLLQVARICEQKGQHVAIEVASRAGRKLVLAGKVDPDGEAYFHDKVEPHLGSDVRWIEDVAGEEKSRLLCRASAMLFPLQWEEPFGLAMVEAMVTGTPVVALRRGAAPELIEPGVTGFLAEDEEGLVEALRHLDEIDPIECATRSRDRFSAARAADGYEAVYRAAMDQGSRAAIGHGSRAG